MERFQCTIVAAATMSAKFRETVTSLQNARLPHWVDHATRKAKLPEFSPNPAVFNRAAISLQKLDRKAASRLDRSTSQNNYRNKQIGWEHLRNNKHDQPIPRVLLHGCIIMQLIQKIGYKQVRQQQHGGETRPTRRLVPSTRVLVKLPACRH